MARMVKDQIVTFTLFRFNGGRNRWWAFRQMGISRWLLQKVSGMQFGKMLGSGGGNGFSTFPNFGVYGFLGIWDNQDAAQQCFTNHPFFTEMVEKSTEHWTIFLRTFKAHGKWDVKEPFQITETYQEGDPVAVLTRATIRTRSLLSFWKNVPSVSQSIETAPGNIFSIGVGELPFVQQVTFSLWENSQAMKNYAYKSQFHSKVVKQTRQQGWFKEELFARFVPYATQGSWEKKNPLEKYLLPTARTLAPDSDRK